MGLFYDSVVVVVVVIVVVVIVVFVVVVVSVVVVDIVVTMFFVVSFSVMLKLETRAPIGAGKCNLPPFQKIMTDRPTLRPNSQPTN